MYKNEKWLKIVILVNNNKNFCYFYFPIVFPEIWQWEKSAKLGIRKKFTVTRRSTIRHSRFHSSKTSAAINTYTENKGSLCNFFRAVFE